MKQQKNRRCRHFCTLVLKVEENFMPRLPTFLLFLWSQKIGLKALLTCAFIPSLLTLESSKKYTVRLFLTSRVGGERLFLFSWDTLEGVYKEPIVSSEAVPEDCKKILDQNLIKALLIVAVCTVLF